MSQNRSPYRSRGMISNYDAFDSSKARSNRSYADINPNDIRSPENINASTDFRVSERYGSGPVDSAQYKNLEHRYRLLEDEKKRVEEEYRKRSESQFNATAELRTAIHKLTLDLEAKEREVERARLENEKLLKENSNHGEETHSIVQEFENLKKNLDAVKEEETYQKKKLIDSRQNASIIEELERMTAVKEKAEALAEEYSNRISELEKINRDLEFQAKKSKQEIEALQSYSTRLNEELKERDRTMQGLEQKQEEYLNVIRTLETKNQKLSELNDTIKKDTLFYQTKCQEEEKEKMDLENKLMEIGSVVREKEFAIEDMRNNIELIDKSRNDVIKDNYYFMEELNTTRDKIQQLDMDQQELLEIFHKAINEEQGIKAVVEERKALEDSRNDMKHSILKSVSKVKALLSIK